MILINLLPPEYQEKPAAKAGISVGILQRFSLKALAIAAGSLFVLLVAGALLFVFFSASRLQTQLAAIEKQSAAIKKDLAIATALEKEEEELKKVVTVLETIIKSRILWAPILNDLSDATPDQVQLTRLAVRVEEIKPEKKKTQAAKAKKGKRGEKALEAGKEKALGKEKEKPKQAEKKKEGKKIHRYLVLEGILLGGGDEAVVYLFLENLRKAEHFYPYFSDIGLAGLRSNEDGSKEFTIRCRFGRE